jgi:hypothetical protein
LDGIGEKSELFELGLCVLLPHSGVLTHKFCFSFKFARQNSKISYQKCSWICGFHDSDHFDVKTSLIGAFFMNFAKNEDLQQFFWCGGSA